MHKLMISALLPLAVACAAQQREATTPEDDEAFQQALASGEIECHEEAVVGSMIPERVCTRKGENDARSQAVQEYVHCVQRQSLNASGKGQ